ncbi:MAG: SOS response-associated peptidase [Anaerolineaceae bacterium]
MCGRFAIMFDPEELGQKLELGDLPPDLKSNSNISPGTNIPVVLDAVDRNVKMFRWGLIPGWAKDVSVGYKMINARAETIDEKPSFRVAFQRRRCLIPADGFYEWKIEDGHKYPYLFTLKDRKPFTFAGLWETWRSQEGGEINSCTIITTEPNSLVAQYHNRMPVILGYENRWRWLEERTKEELKAMLIPCQSGIMDIPQQVNRL